VLWDAVGFSAARMHADARGLAALKSEVEYRHEVFPGQSLSVRSSIVEVGAKTARFRHVMHVSTEEGPALAAICTYLVCCLDREGRKGAEWPADMKQSLAAWAAAAVEAEEGASREGSA
jgi:acyl-CoA thioester hydrolase